MQPADALDPTFARQHDVGVFADDVGGGIELDDLFAAADGGPALVGELGRELFEFRLDDVPEFLFRRQHLADLVSLGAFLAQLFEDRVDLQLRDAIELQFQDRHRLRFVEREDVHQLVGGIALAGAVADDLQRLVEVVEDQRETFEDVNAVLKLPQLELEAPSDRLQAKGQEMPQHFGQSHPCRDQGTVLVR